MSYINLLGSQWHDAHIVHSFYSNTLYEVINLSSAICSALINVYPLKQFFFCICLKKISCSLQ